MKNDVKIYSIVLGISVILLLLEVFVLKLLGFVGLGLCIICLYLIIGIIIRLIGLSGLIKSEVLEKIDILFF